MTEETWFASSPKGGVFYVQAMLDFLGARLSRRKQVLLACGSFYLYRQRHKDGHESPWEFQAREVAERFVDGKATLNELNAVRATVEEALAADPYPRDLFHNTLPDTGGQALNLLKLACGEFNALADMPGGYMPYVRPFPFQSAVEEEKLVRDVVGNPFQPPVPVAAAWLTWNSGSLPTLARRLYDERAFVMMRTLADALQQAGCNETAMLAHCRGPGLHIRGCWVIDRFLGLE